MSKAMGTTGLPGEGYTIKWMQAITVSVRPSLTGNPVKINAAGAVKKAVGHLTGDERKLPAFLMEKRLAQIDEELVAASRPARRTPHTLRDITSQLCQWYHAGMPEESSGYEHVMRAAL